MFIVGVPWNVVRIPAWVSSYFMPTNDASSEVFQKERSSISIRLPLGLLFLQGSLLLETAFISCTFELF